MTYIDTDKCYGNAKNKRFTNFLARKHTDKHTVQF